MLKSACFFFWRNEICMLDHLIFFLRGGCDLGFWAGLAGSKSNFLLPPFLFLPENTGPQPIGPAWYMGHRFQMLDNTASFLFLYFSKIFFYRNIFLISQFTVLYPYRPEGGGRGPAAWQEGGRDLYINKKKLFARRPLTGACRHSTRRQRACRPAGGRQAPPPRKIAAVGH